MKSPYWAKLPIGLLDDPNIGRMQEWLFARLTKFVLVAKEFGNDGLLPPVCDIAWRLRLDETKVSEALSALERVGEACLKDDQWTLTHFAEWQAAASGADRSRNYRHRQKIGEDDEDETDLSPERDENETNASRKSDENATNEMQDSISSSTSSSISNSGSKSELDLLYESWRRSFPQTPKEACQHPALVLFETISDGIPAERDYRKVIEWVCLVGQKFRLNPAELELYLRPYCLFWSGHKRDDGKPYDPLNPQWVVWAYNKIPLDREPAAKPAAKPPVDNVKRTGALEKLRQEANHGKP